MKASQHSIRALLRSIGIGDFNATLVIQSMFIAPATTDPKSASTILLVQHLQRILNRQGAKIRETGYLDHATAGAIQAVAGPGWEQRPWADTAQAILLARDTGQTWRDDPPPPPNYGPTGMPLGFLPDVPGGMLTYGIAAVVAYHLWKQRKGKS